MTTWNEFGRNQTIESKIIIRRFHFYEYNNICYLYLVLCHVTSSSFELSKIDKATKKYGHNIPAWQI